MPHGSHDDDKLAVRSGEHVFTVSYSRSNGLQIEREAHHVEHAPDVGEQEVFEWVRRMQQSDPRTRLNWAQVWAYTMVVLQITAFMLLQFEPGGMRDPNGVARYISDNIAAHRGIGGVMVLAFANTYCLLAMFSVPVGVFVVLMTMLFFSAGGGAGVVLFHTGFELQHLISAACFIGGGLGMHIVLILYGPWRFIHGARDTVIVLGAVLAGATFAATLIYARERDKDLKGPEHPLAGRNVDLKEWWWVSAIAEYMLYLNCCVLNGFAGQRLMEQASYSMFRQLPALCERASARA